MINQNKSNDPKCWAKWKASGAVGTIDDAQLRAVLSSHDTQRHYHQISNRTGYNGIFMNNFDREGHIEFVERTTYERQIPYKGCGVLVVQVHLTTDKTSHDYVLVPGYVKSREKNISFVVTIEDEKDRSELAKILEKQTEGNIIFWRRNPIRYDIFENMADKKLRMIRYK